MAQQPRWYGQLTWSTPISVAVLNTDRKAIPDFSGCYVFTLGNGPMLPNQVLYVGEAKVSLRQRLPVYLVDWTNPLPAGTKMHKGKAFILAERKRVGDQGVYVRWVEYGGGPADISLLESSLIDFLQPLYNDRDEYARHGALGDWERLDRRLLR
jgi:hypothetical protein